MATHPLNLKLIPLTDRFVSFACDDGSWEVPEGLMLLVKGVPPFKKNTTVKATIKVTVVEVTGMTEAHANTTEFAIMHPADFKAMMAFFKDRNMLAPISAAERN